MANLLILAEITVYFLKYREVRFAQRQVQLIDAVLNNLTGCKMVWSKLEQEGHRKEKADAKGFNKTWNKKEIWLTSLMDDIIRYLPANVTGIRIIRQQLKLRDSNISASYYIA